MVPLLLLLPLLALVAMGDALPPAVFTALRAPALGLCRGVWAAYAAGCAALYLLDDWAGFAGALAVAATVPTMALPLLQSALTHDPLVALLGAWAVAVAQWFFGVLTVAYAFLPGAWVMREHTGALLAVPLLIIIQTVVKAAGDRKSVV